MDASDDADVVDWSCCRCVVVDDVMDVEVVDPSGRCCHRRDCCSR